MLSNDVNIFGSKNEYVLRQSLLTEIHIYLKRRTTPHRQSHCVSRSETDTAMTKAQQKQRSIIHYIDIEIPSNTNF